ncbi:MAG TPA: TetR/AcrR family transcriptional regulator [Saprospirales bacterium]|nr:TetR/AcrR family transcriptional regulator [Saprospirales bacterium]
MLLSKAERTRQYIVEKTAPVFNTKGYAGTSINDLMEATGLSKGSIYGNFENKDEVALAAFDFNFSHVIHFLKTEMSSRETIIEKLLVYPDTYRNFLTLPLLKAGCPILNTSTEADDTHPLLKEKAANALLFWKNSVEQLIQKGIERNEIKPDTNVAAFAIILMSLIEGAVMQAKVTGQNEPLHITMDYLHQIILDLKP